MRLEFHTLSRSDISTVMDYYEDAGGPELADEFYSELWTFLRKAVNSPESYAIRERDIRRVNLDKFPFHFLYRALMIAFAFSLFVTILAARRWRFAGAKFVREEFDVH